MKGKLRSKLSRIWKKPIYRNRKVSAENSFANECTLCKRKSLLLQAYLDDSGNFIKVCDLCKPYAERRAYIRI
ncbi:hypothetical protein [Bacillus wiedmannii]|uniref:hypothetical protein n=1 Tax=Bacillus wiedmannii TaxID=1890302 RepID=UPI003D98BB52